MSILYCNWQRLAQAVQSFRLRSLSQHLLPENFYLNKQRLHIRSLLVRSPVSDVRFVVAHWHLQVIGSTCAHLSPDGDFNMKQSREIRMF